MNMSGAISATTAVAISAGVAAVGTAASVMASNKQARQQKAAAKEAQRNNEITQTKAREDKARDGARSLYPAVEKYRHAYSPGNRQIPAARTEERGARTLQ